MAGWTVETSDDGSFEKFFRKLPEYEQAVLTAAVTHVLERYGPDICQSEWGKPLQGGLYEFRVRRSLTAILREAGVEAPTDVAAPNTTVLLRVFCTFHGARIILLLGGYDKKRDPSKRRQALEIKRARTRLKAWRNRSDSP